MIHDLLKQFKINALHHVEGNQMICFAIRLTDCDKMCNVDLNLFLAKVLILYPLKTSD